jgi:hypothetical protein
MMKNVLTKLNKIQTELKAPKGQMNKFGNYRYRSCEDILEAVKPLLAEHKCVLPISDKVNLIGDRYYIEATATLIDCESGESYSVTASAREEESKKGMDGSQVTGASSSYARKYALNGLLDIDDTKDSDATNTHGKEEKPDPQADMPPEERTDANKKVNDTQIDYLQTMIIETDTNVGKFLKAYDISRLEDMTLDCFVNEAKPALEKKQDQMKKAAKK